jgi:hypothetical protein
VRFRQIEEKGPDGRIPTTVPVPKKGSIL